MQTSKSLSLLCLIESEEFGPVFIQEPDDVIFPLDSDEKKVVMHCEARGNPPPTYRCDTYLSALLIAVLLSQLISSHFSKCTLLLLLVLFFSAGTSIGQRWMQRQIIATASLMEI